MHTIGELQSFCTQELKDNKRLQETNQSQFTMYQFLRANKKKSGNGRLSFMFSWTTIFLGYSKNMALCISRKVSA